MLFTRCGRISLSKVLFHSRISPLNSTNLIIEADVFDLILMVFAVVYVDKYNLKEKKRQIYVVLLF